MSAGQVQFPPPRLATRDGVLVAGVITPSEEPVPPLGGGRPPGGGGASGQGSDRKYRAKRFNEQIKSAYSLLNTLASAVIVTGFVNPTILGQPLPFGLDTPALLIIGLCLHLFGQGLVFLLTRREE